MAEFHHGFTFEFDTVGPLSIEGRPFSVPAGSTRDTRRAIAHRAIEGSPELATRRDTARAHAQRLRGTRDAWNAWRRDEPAVRPMLTCTDLSGLSLDDFDLSYANLTQATLTGARLRGANLHQAILAKADLTGADLTGANLCRTDLYETTFTNATLVDVNLQGAQLVRNEFAGATITNCDIYGMSAWDVRLDAVTLQQDLLVRYRPLADGEEQRLRVHDLLMAAFTYSAINNRNLARLFNDAGRTWVLLLGRFAERKDFLQQLAAALSPRFIPIIFDFPRPEQRDLIETVLLLAGMSAFVIADLTNASSTPLELQAIVPQYAVPVVPVVLGSSDGLFSMFADLRKFDWVLPPLVYDTPENLVNGLEKAIVEPATAKARSLIDWKARTLQTRHIRDYL